MRITRLIAPVLAGLVLSLVVGHQASAQSFVDVPSDHPYFTAIDKIADLGIIGGYSNGNLGRLILSSVSNSRR